VSALSADYQVLPNGTAYLASIEVQDVAQYEFYDIGVMGQRVPLEVHDVRLAGTGCENCTFNWRGASAIAFNQGNYTVSFMGQLHEDHLQGIFDEKHDVNITFPREFDIRNPLLGSLSPTGANVTRYLDNTTSVRWNNATDFDVRFYDNEREDLLFLFGNFWIVIAIVLLLPFLMTMRKNR
jgi:hypothetical protein